MDPPARPARRVRFGAHGAASQDELINDIATDADLEVPSEQLMGCIEQISFEKHPDMRGQMLGSSLMATAVILEEFVTHYLAPLWQRRRASPEMKRQPTRDQLLRAQRQRRARRYRPVLHGEALRARMQRLRDRSEARDDWFAQLMSRGPLPKAGAADEDLSWIQKEAVKEAAQRSLLKAYAKRQAEIAELRARSGLPPVRDAPAKK